MNEENRQSWLYLEKHNKVFSTIVFHYVNAGKSPEEIKGKVKEKTNSDFMADHCYRAALHVKETRQ